MTLTCDNPDCPERGVDKHCDLELGPADVVYCGDCGAVLFTGDGVDR